MQSFRKLFKAVIQAVFFRKGHDWLLNIDFLCKENIVYYLSVVHFQKSRSSHSTINL